MWWKTSNSCENDCKWIFDEKTKPLFIRGSGKIKDYGWIKEEEAPTTLWFSTREQIKTVVPSEEITTIRGWVFSDCSLTSISFPNSITTVEECAFCGCLFVSNVIPNNTMISGNVFSRCFSLTTATLHETFEKQKDGIFVVVTSNKHTLG